MNLDNSNNVKIGIAYSFSCVYWNPYTIQNTNSQPTEDAKWFDVMGNWIISLLSRCYCTIRNLRVSPKKTIRWHEMLHANVDQLPMHFSLKNMCIFSCSTLWDKWILGRSSAGKTLSEERPNLAFDRIPQFPLTILLCFLCVHEVLLVLQISCTWTWLWTMELAFRPQIRVQGADQSKSQDFFGSVRLSLLSA